jgi:hypothetical protein
MEQCGLEFLKYFGEKKRHKTVHRQWEFCLFSNSVLPRSILKVITIPMAGALNSSQMLVSGNRQRNSTITSHVPTASRPVPSRPMRPSFRTRVSSATPSTEPKPDPFATKEVYSDSDPISKFSIWYFSKVMSENLGNKPFDGTYDSFVELSREIMRGRSTKQQQETVASVLGNLLPPQSPQRFRQWFPLSRRTAEFNAWITTLGFTWLVRII